MEISDRKRCREENPEALASPEQVSKKKKKKRKKQHVGSPPQVCPNPLLLETKIQSNATADLGPKQETLISETEKGAGPIVATVEHPVPDPTPQKKTKRKKKNKNMLGAEPGVEHPQLCSTVDSEVKSRMKNGEGSTNVGIAESLVPQPTAPIDTPKKKNKLEKENQNVHSESKLKESNNAENPQLCFPLDTERREKINEWAGPKEATAEHQVVETTRPEDTPQRKKHKKKQKNVLNAQGMGPELMDSRNAEHPQLCSPEKTGPMEATGEPQVIEAMHLEDTIHKKKRKKKQKNVLNPQGMGPELMDSSNAEHPQLCSPVNPELENKMKNRAEPNEANVERPQACPVDPETAKDQGKNKEAEPREARAEHPQLQLCCMSGPSPPGDPTTPVDQSIGKHKHKRGKKETICSEDKVKNHSNPMRLDVTFNPALSHLLDPAIPVCPIPALPMNQGSLGDPAIPIDVEQKTKKKRKKQRKSALDGEKPKENIMDQPETPIPKSICHIAAPPAEPTILIDPHPSILTETAQKSEGKSDKNQDSALGRYIVEPNESYGKTPETTVQKLMSPMVAPALHQTTPVSLAIPIDTEEKMKKKRKKKRKSALDEVVPNENISKQPETPSQTSIRIEAATPAKATILMDPGRDTVVPVDPAMSTGQEQKTSKTKRKKKSKSALNGKGAQPACPIATPSLNPTTLSDQTLQVGAAAALQTTGLSVTDIQVLSILGCLSLMGINYAVRPPVTSIQGANGPLVSRAPLESPGTKFQGINNTVPPPEASIQGANGPLVSRAPLESPGTNFQGINNVAPPTEALIQGANGPLVSRAPFESSGKSFLGINDAQPPPEALIQRADGPSVTTAPSEWPGKNFQGINYAEPPPEALIQGANGPLVARDPFEFPGKSYKECHACRKGGHNFRKCPRLKRLSKDDEICFFCGEIGHSLGKCSVSHAGGGRFARCLFCHAQGHFSNNCPRNGRGMVVAANEPSNKMTSGVR